MNERLCHECISIMTLSPEEMGAGVRDSYKNEEEEEESLFEKIDIEQVKKLMH